MRTLRYGESDEQVADVRGAGPAVVLLHGGCWREQNRRDLEEAVAVDLAARRFTTLNVEYRRLDCSGETWPAMLDDVLAAIALLGEPPIALVGHSAGGYLALHASATTGIPAIAHAPVTDLAAAERQGACPGALDRIRAGGAPDPPALRTALVIHGDSDEHVPVEQSRDYAARTGCRYEELAGVGHMAALDPASAQNALQLRWLERLRAR